MMTVGRKKSKQELRKEIETRTLLDEITYTDKIQSMLDYANDNVFRNFKLRLIMEDAA